MTTEEIPALIASARESAAFEIDELGEDAYTGQLLISLADALEAAHKRAEFLDYMANSAEMQLAIVETAIDNARLYCENQGDKFHYHAEQILGFLSRAIDTSEQS